MQKNLRTYVTTVDWYQQLKKPSWAPPSWLFAPVWTGLYILISVSYAYVGWEFFRRQLPATVLIPFVLNLIFNAAFTPLQFGLRSNTLAAADILLVLATLVWAMIAIWPHAHWVVVVTTPYLLWVSFATVLQMNVTILNWRA